MYHVVFNRLGQYLLFLTILQTAYSDDSKFKGEITWIPLSQPKYWQVAIDSIKLGAYSSTATSGIVDSGTSLITGPSSEIMQIALSVGAMPNLLGQYSIDCAKVPNMPSLDFSMNGKTFTVPGKDLVIESGGMCVFAMMGMDIPDKVGLSTHAFSLYVMHVHL